MSTQLVVDVPLKVKAQAPRLSSLPDDDFSKIHVMESVNAIPALMAIPVIKGLQPDGPRLPDDDLDSFLIAAGALKNATAVQTGVFVWSHFFDEKEFQVKNPDYDHFNQQPDNPEFFDAREYDLRLKQFESRVGEDSLYFLQTYLPQTTLSVVIARPWYREFMQMMSETGKTLMEIINKTREALEATQKAQTERLQTLVSLIQGLSTDAGMLKLKTNKEMRAYALKVHPELTELTETAPNILDDAISALKAEIGATQAFESRSH